MPTFEEIPKHASSSWHQSLGNILLPDLIKCHVMLIAVSYILDRCEWRHRLHFLWLSCKGIKINMVVVRPTETEKKKKLQWIRKKSLSQYPPGGTEKPSFQTFCAWSQGGQRGCRVQRGEERRGEIFCSCRTNISKPLNHYRAPSAKDLSPFFSIVLTQT